MSAESLDIVGREIFSGPYGRYSANVPWSETAPPAIKPHTDNIIEIVVRAWNDIDALQVKYGPNWGALYGNSRGGAQNVMTLKVDEHIINVDVSYGHKIGRLGFDTNKGKYGPFGMAKNAKFSEHVNHTGYALSSMGVTHYGGAPPSGIEGIFFGFRSLLLA
ncbi:Delta endotoxin [Fusarium austroafricanum]|uniref:Delta endotoxin n=1 Tax=Fusarium austroafricanum TaxID=2364996 RepID=A0A8H4P5A1_9HYPO|nr:Delta endotoxin [Fusarium austroafricanum]